MPEENQNKHDNLDLHLRVQKTELEAKHDKEIYSLKETHKEQINSLNLNYKQQLRVELKKQQENLNKLFNAEKNKIIEKHISEIQKLTEQNQQIINENSTLKSEIEPIKAENTALKSEIEQIKVEISALKAEIEPIKTENTALKSEIEKINQVKKTEADEKRKAKLKELNQIE